MYAIYGNIYHQYTPNVGIYIPYMDPMGFGDVWPMAMTSLRHNSSLRQAQNGRCIDYYDASKGSAAFGEMAMLGAARFGIEESMVKKPPIIPHTPELAI